MRSLALALLLLSPTSNVQRPRSASPLPPGGESQVQDGPTLEQRRDALSAKLAELRGLAWKTPLKIREGNRTGYAEFVLENAKRLYGDDLSAAEKGLKALGLLPPKIRLDLAITAQAGIGVKVYCSDGELVLLDPKAGDEWLVNKMDLGLVDQHFAPKVAPTLDAQLAFAALRMGDAEVAKYLFRHEGKLPADLAKKLTEEARTWETSDSKLASSVVPRLFVRTGDFAWRRGGAFAMGLHEKGELAKAWASPPVSTEQVIHPEKYAAAEAPAVIDPGPVSKFLEAKGWKESYRSVFGELGAAVVLETHFPKEDLAAASEGWGGDTLAVFEKEGAPPLILWATDWDREKDAEEFHAPALKIVLKLMSADPQLMTPIERRGTAVALAVNVPKDLQDGLLEALWTCARTKGTSKSPYGRREW
jgi:hypothetical protein